MIYTLTLNPALDMELTVDQLEFGKIHRAITERYDVGGKGFNVSRVLSVMEVENIALGFVGGTNGRRISSGLLNAGIQSDLVEISGETRTNVSIVGAIPKEYIKVNQAGPMISLPEASRMLDKISDLIRPDDLMILSGSLPPGVEQNYYSQVIQLVRSAGGMVILDTSGKGLASALQDGIRLIKPNGEEAEEVTRISIRTLTDAAKAARSLQHHGVQTVVVSMGGDGLVAVEEDQSWIAIPPKIEVKNTVGAGDALVAGLAAGIHAGLDLVETIRLGTACGASAASQPGTGIGSRHEIEAFIPQVIVHSLG